jgi:hypothetical protein
LSDWFYFAIRISPIKYFDSSFSNPIIAPKPSREKMPVNHVERTVTGITEMERTFYHQD